MDYTIWVQIPRTPKHFVFAFSCNTSEVCLITFATNFRIVQFSDATPHVAFVSHKILIKGENKKLSYYSRARVTANTALTLTLPWGRVSSPRPGQSHGRQTDRHFVDSQSKFWFRGKYRNSAASGGRGILNPQPGDQIIRDVLHPEQGLQGQLEDRGQWGEEPGGGPRHDGYHQDPQVGWILASDWSWRITWP